LSPPGVYLWSDKPGEMLEGFKQLIKRRSSMWEIIANAKEYGIEVLEEGIGNSKKTFEDQERTIWAEEIGTFAIKMSSLAEKAKQLQQLLISDDQIVATPASLKTLKVQMFKINDAMTTSLELAQKIESEIIKKNNEK
jgi:hypothetical protein